MCFKKKMLKCSSQTEKVCVFTSVDGAKIPAAVWGQQVLMTVVMLHQHTPLWWHRTIHCVYFHYKSHENDTRSVQDNHTHIHAHQVGLSYVDILLVKVGVRLLGLINLERHDHFHVFQFLLAFMFWFWNALWGKHYCLYHILWCDLRSRIRPGKWQSNWDI